MQFVKGSGKNENLCYEMASPDSSQTEKDKFGNHKMSIQKLKKRYILNGFMQVFPMINEIALSVWTPCALQ